MTTENIIQGESPLVIDGKELTLVYDWPALAKLSKKFGGNVNLFEPDVLAGALEIGLLKHHKDVKASHILAASPPLIDAIAAFNMAMQRAYFGHKEPPKDAGANPLMAGMLNQTGSAASPARSDSPSEQESSLANSGG